MIKWSVSLENVKDIARILFFLFLKTLTAVLQIDNVKNKGEGFARCGWALARCFLFFSFFFPTLERLSENEKRLLAERRRKVAVCLFSQCDRPRLIERWLYCLMQTGFSIYINEGAAFRQIHVEIGVDNAAPREGKKAGCVINSADMLERSKNTFLLRLHKQKMLVWTTAAESRFLFFFQRPERRTLVNYWSTAKILLLINCPSDFGTISQLTQNSIDRKWINLQQDDFSLTYKYDML